MQCKSNENMEGIENNHSPPTIVQIEDVQSCKSAENFQKFIYELFEKNGVINDLRAYLRGHIVGVLRGAQTGNPPTCQKHFTQRLDLPFQAMNILIAEYLLRLEFSYTLSVFVSEIPLANMVFVFSKALMEGTNNCDPSLRFTNEDVWSILNYLGVKCDSKHALNIVNMYKAEMQSPLLLCILKCLPMYEELHANASQDSLSSSGKSSSSVVKGKSHHSPPEKCKHCMFCRTCQRSMMSVKEKYKKKNKTLAENIKDTSAKNMEHVMTNIELVETNLINEMFQQLKSVYESEISMMKNDEEERFKRSLTTSALQLQKKRVEMEEKFKAREAELERNVQQKKRFLWSLARDLRDQHKNMSRAMHDVQAETARLFAKEDSLKSQLAEAEQILRERGEEMRAQISNELAVLEGHLADMKKERDCIDKEREELEHIKRICDNTKTTNCDSSKEELRSHYEILANELSILKKYLATAKVEPKCVTERGTITDLADLKSKIEVVLNNEQDVERNRSEDKLKAKQLVNDLKNRKNVNFNEGKMDEIYRSRSRSILCRSSASSDLDSEQRLREENERLRTFARQQRDHIDELSSQQARLHAELAARQPRGAAPGTQRPRTAPAIMPDTDLFARLNRSGSGNSLSLGWRKGAGEELGFFANARPATSVVVPGDTLPFIGVVRDRHNDHRRYLINQWRSLQRRLSPVRVAKPRSGSPASRNWNRERADVAGPCVRAPSEEDASSNNGNRVHIEDQRHQTPRESNEQRKKTIEEKVKKRETSPSYDLREVKDKLSRSPRQENNHNSVIRDAKLRLRKLEIEAEAVEKSYLDFRRKQEKMRCERMSSVNNDDVGTSAIKESDLGNNKADKPDTKESTSNNNEEKKPTTNLDAYIKEYRAIYDISKTHFKNNNAASCQVKPVPAAFSLYESIINVKKTQNYLETPMAEFRKYYQTEKRANESRLENTSIRNSDKDTEDTKTQDNLTSSQLLRSPTFKSKNGWDRPQTSITKNRDDSRNSTTPTLVNLETIKEIIDAKSPVTKNRNDSSSDNRPKSVNHSESVEDREFRESNLSQINSGTIVSRNDAKSPLNRHQDDCGSNKSPSPNTYPAEIEDLESAMKKNQGFSDPYNKKSMLTNSAQIKSRSQSLTSDSANRSEGPKTDEIQILKQNIGELYNVSEESLEEHERKTNMDEAIKEISRRENSGDTDNKEHAGDKNLLRIELQSVSEVNDVKITDSLTQDVLLVVESPADNEHRDHFRTMSTQMTILVTPKKKEPDTKLPERNDDYVEKGIKMNGNDVFGAEENQNDRKSASDVEANQDPDYLDDFSVDVDNFNSSRYDDTDGIRSPISLPKTSDDDNFWDP